MKKLRSSRVATAPSIGRKNDGQPVPESNFASEVNSGAPQPAQAYTPARFSRLSGEVPARSVPWQRSTRYASGERMARHSSSVF
jgi:hypothetical protein